GGDNERQGVEPSSARAFVEGFIEPTLERQTLRIPLVRRRVARVKLNCPPELPFGRLPIIVVLFGNQRERCMRFRQRSVELQRFERGCARLGHEILRGNVLPCAEQRERIRQTGVGRRVVCVFVDRLLEVFGGLVQAGLRPLVPEVAALQAEIVYLIGNSGGGGKLAGGFPSRLVAQRELYLICGFLRDFCLQGQQVTQFAIVLPRPQMRLVFDLNQLR